LETYVKNQIQFSDDNVGTNTLDIIQNLQTVNPAFFAPLTQQAGKSSITGNKQNADFDIKDVSASKDDIWRNLESIKKQYNK
jgi:hypothetical protein